MIVKDLTEEQQEIFTKTFYDRWTEKLDFNTDLDSPAPWGCPWYSCGDEDLIGNTIEEMAENFFDSVIDDILECSKTW